jgi:hypothetical protein
MACPEPSREGPGEGPGDLEGRSGVGAGWERVGSGAKGGCSLILDRGRIQSASDAAVLGREPRLGGPLGGPPPLRVSALCTLGGVGDRRGGS